MAYVPESTIGTLIRARFRSMLFTEILRGRSSDLLGVVLDFIILETFSQNAAISFLHTLIIEKVYTLCIHFFYLCDDFDRFRVRMVLRTE